MPPRYRFEGLPVGSHLGLAFLALFAITSLFTAGAARASDESSIRFRSDHDLNHGAFALNFGRFDEGIRLTQKGLDGSHRAIARSAGLSNLCAGFVGNADYQLAIAHCTAALELNERNWQAYNNRGYAYYKLGDLQAARHDVERGLKLKPNSRELILVERLVAQH
jgi:Flp pilus assembly protein TadD